MVSNNHGGNHGGLNSHRSPLPEYAHQRFQVHYASNLLSMLGAAELKGLRADLRAILAEPARVTALRIISSVAEKWREKGHSRVVEHLEKHVEKCISRAWSSMRSLTAGMFAPHTAL